MKCKMLRIRPLAIFIVGAPALAATTVPKVFGPM